MKKFIAWIKRDLELSDRLAWLACALAVAAFAISFIAFADEKYVCCRATPPASSTAAKGED